MSLLVPRSGDWCDDQLASKEVLVWILICFLGLRKLPVQGMDEGLIMRRGASIHRVQIRNQLVSEAHGLLHDIAALHVELPRLSEIEYVVVAMQSEDGRPAAQLVPARGTFVVLVAVHVSADVVAPPAIADVGRSG